LNFQVKAVENGGKASSKWQGGRRTGEGEAVLLFDFDSVRLFKTLGNPCDPFPFPSSVAPGDVPARPAQLAKLSVQFVMHIATPHRPFPDR
jgi:hypothetical protein